MELFHRRYPAVEWAVERQGIAIKIWYMYLAIYSAIVFVLHFSGSAVTADFCT